MKKHNQDVFKLMNEKGICSAWVATEIGMYDSNFCRLMRLPLKPRRHKEVLNAIEKLSREVNK